MKRLHSAGFQCQLNCENFEEHACIFGPSLLRAFKGWPTETLCVSVKSQHKQRISLDYAFVGEQIPELLSPIDACEYYSPTTFRPHTPQSCSDCDRSLPTAPDIPTPSTWSPVSPAPSTPHGTRLDTPRKHAGSSMKRTRLFGDACENKKATPLLPASGHDMVNGRRPKRTIKRPKRYSPY